MWRNSGHGLKFLGIDGRFAFAVFLLMYSPSMFSLYIFIGSFVILYILQYYGYSVANAARKLQVFLAGKKRPAVPHRYQ